MSDTLEVSVEAPVEPSAPAPVAGRGERPEESPVRRGRCGWNRAA